MSKLEPFLFHTTGLYNGREFPKNYNNSVYCKTFTPFFERSFVYKLTDFRVQFSTVRTFIHFFSNIAFASKKLFSLWVLSLSTVCEYLMTLLTFIGSRQLYFLEVWLTVRLPIPTKNAWKLTVLIFRHSHRFFQIAHLFLLYFLWYERNSSVSHVVARIKFLLSE